LKDALAAALKMPALDWVILSNLASQWVAIGKEQISAILDDLRSDALEDLITRAVRSTPEELSSSIESVLPDRELYLELTAGQSQQGQPVMKSFQVADTPNVVRAYLTRSRPGITYGGITWEALKEMIRNEPGIGGVQIVNDADDWVVVDRESLRLGSNDESQ
jgi:hypothetical protein